MHIPSITLRHSLIICVLAFASVTAPGVLFDGFTSDDWIQLWGAPDIWVVVGRWAMHLLYKYVFFEHFILPLQITLAFFCFAWVSYLLAQYAVEDEFRSTAMAPIFIVGVNHIYMCDVLVFASHVFGYSLALACSLSAFHILKKFDRSSGVGRNAMIIGASAQLLALSLGLYQPFAVFGLLIPLLVLIKTEIGSLKSELAYFLLCVVVGVLALVAYFVELDLYQRATGLALYGLDAPALSGQSNLDSLWETTKLKFQYLPGILNRVHSLGRLSAPGELVWFNRALPAVIMAMTAVLAVSTLWRDKQSRPFGLRLLDSSRLVFAVVSALFIAPVLIYFTHAWYLPPRTLGYIGFSYSAVFLAILALIYNLARDQERAKLVQSAGLGALCVVGIVHMIVASAVWQDRKRIGDRDLELARAVFSRVTNLAGYDGSQFRIYGGVRYEDRLMWGSSLSRTIFRPYKFKEPDEIRMGIFKELYDLPWTAEVIPYSPIPCPAFPANASVFLHEGTAYVCLDASD